MKFETKYIWINGKILLWDEAFDHVYSQSLYQGTCAYEGIRFYQAGLESKIFRWQDHWHRFIRSNELLNYHFNYQESDILNSCKKLINLNNFSQGYIKLISYSGYGQEGNNNQLSLHNFQIIVSETEKFITDHGLDIVISPEKIINNLQVRTNTKISGYNLQSTVAYNEALKNGFDDTILIDQDNNIIGSTNQNIFFIQGNSLITPTNLNIFPGITRDTIMKITKEKLEFYILENNIKFADLADFEEAFVASTLFELRPINFIQNTNSLQKHFQIKKFYTIHNLFQEIVSGKDLNYIQWLY